jgi:hypothetical protein
MAGKASFGANGIRHCRRQARAAAKFRRPGAVPQAGAIARLGSAGRLRAAAAPPAHHRCTPSPNRPRNGEIEMSNFWDLVLLMISTFFFVAYLIVMFQIVVDLFRDDQLGGGSKVLWAIGLIFLPVFTALVYIVARGAGMAARSRASVERARSDTEAYIKGVAGRSPAAEIAEAKALLDAGTITQAEFDKLKAKALS